MDSNWPNTCYLLLAKGIEFCRDWIKFFVTAFVVGLVISLLVDLNHLTEPRPATGMVEALNVKIEVKLESPFLALYSRITIEIPSYLLYAIDEVGRACATATRDEGDRPSVTMAFRTGWFRFGWVRCPPGRVPLPPGP